MPGRVSGLQVNVRGHAGRRPFTSLLIALLLPPTLACAEEASIGPPSPVPGAAAPASITVTPSEVTLPALGETVQLTARLLSRTGRELASGAIVWGSRDTTVAMAASTGLVTAVGNGTTSVTAASGRVAGHADVAVIQRAVQLDLSPPADTLRTYGDTVRLAAHAIDANGHAIPGRAMLWISSETSIASVESTGLVTATGNGTATVSVESGDRRAGVEVTVYDHQAAIAEDRGALMTVFDATGGDGWVSKDNWGSDQPLSSWFGVSTGPDGRVTGLELAGNALGGEQLPPELGRLGRLKTLHLQHNRQLGDSIPPELGDLRDLESLNLEGSMRLRSPVPPELGRLTKLKHLNLRDTDVSDPLPPELGNLSALESLVLGQDRADSALPAWLGRLSSLESLHISHSGMTGPIPPELGNLLHLKEFFLHHVVLVDSLPPELGNLVNLEALEFVDTGLIGSIPPELGKLSRLELLILTNDPVVTGLTGEIPPELGDLGSLRYLDLSRNRLRGAIPPELGDLPNLESLLLSQNRLTGPIPAQLGGLRSLRGLRLDLNDLRGAVPPELANLSALEVLGLGWNFSMAGPLPPAAVRLSALDVLWIDETGLCVPRDSAFDAWLAGIGNFQGKRCP